MDKVLEYKENISKRLERYDKIVDLEKQTGIDKFYIFVAGAVLTGILLFVIGGAELVVSLVGFIYPAYQSFKAISTPNTDDDTQWLTYWVVYSFFNMTESITDLLLSWCVSSAIALRGRSWRERAACADVCVCVCDDRIPFYFFIKVAFLVWCYHPSTSVGVSLWVSCMCWHRWIGSLMDVLGTFCRDRTSSTSTSSSHTSPHT